MFDDDSLLDEELPLEDESILDEELSSLEDELLLDEDPSSNEELEVSSLLVEEFSISLLVSLLTDSFEFEESVRLQDESKNVINKRLS